VTRAVERLARTAIDVASGLRLRRRRPPAPARTYPEQHVTTVLRVRPATADAIWDQLAPVRERWPDARWYPPGTMHVTVLNLNPVDRSGVDVGAALGTAAAAVPAVTLAYDGFGLSPDSGLVWVDAGDDLRRLRDAVRAAVGLPAPRGLGDRVLATVGYANVVRFEAPPGPEFLRAWRRLPPVGRADQVTAVELVTSDRYLSDDATQLLARVDLGNAAR
jgi:hypothetical protein